MTQHQRFLELFDALFVENNGSRGRCACAGLLREFPGGDGGSGSGGHRLCGVRAQGYEKRLRRKLTEPLTNLARRVGWIWALVGGDLHVSHADEGSLYAGSVAATRCVRCDGMTGLRVTW